MSRKPTAPASRAARRRVVVVAADEHERLPRLGEPGELGAEAGAPRGDADRAGDVRLVELQLGAHVDDQRAVRAACWTWRGVSGCASTTSHDAAGRG